MKARVLLGYQLLTGLSDTATGLLLIFAPALTLRLMGVHAPQDALPFLSWIGAFVLSVGLGCLYGASVIRTAHKLETVWLLTAITRGLVALFVASSIFTGTLPFGWISVPVTDAALAILQTIGLRKGWLNSVPD
jgi:hypothetical protein